MGVDKTHIIKLAKSLGYSSTSREPWKVSEWLREAKQIHVEVGSIWDELNNKVESYFYTVTAPINIYYTQPVYCSGGSSYNEMLLQGLEEALNMLKNFRKQKNVQVEIKIAPGHITNI